jgi:hypothetical protein
MQWQEFRLTEHGKEDSFRMDTIIDVRSNGFGNIFPLLVRLRHTEVGHIKFLDTSRVRPAHSATGAFRMIALRLRRQQWKPSRMFHR